MKKMTFKIDTWDCIEVNEVFEYTDNEGNTKGNYLIISILSVHRNEVTALVAEQ